MKSLNSGGGITKRANGNYYFKIIIDGKEIRKSLKTKNRKEAEKKALALSDDLTATRNTADVVKSVAQAKGIVDHGKLKEINDHSERLAQKKLRISKAMNAYEDLTEAKESTLIEYRRTWKRFIEFVSDDIYLHEIDESLALRFFVHFGKRGLSPSTHNKAVHFCKAICESLKFDAGLIKNPFEPVKLKEKGLQGGKRELTREELLSVGKELDEGIEEERYHREVKTLFIIGRFTGLRLKDVCLLKWKDICLQKRRISLVPAKTIRKGKKIELPIIEPLLLELMEAKQLYEESDYVCPVSATRYNRERTSMNKIIRKVFNGAGIETKIKEENKRAVSVVGFHSLRHTFVSECAKANISLSVVQSLVGHGSPAMTRHYTHIDLGTTASALKSLADESEESELSKDQLLELVKAMNADNWQEIRSHILGNNL